MNREDRRAIVALARKYQTLLAWRAQKQRDGSEPDRAEFRALAKEFPGALRELEVLSVATIEQRARELEACACGEVEPALWMRAIESFHRWMRFALLVRARSAHGRAAMTEHDSDVRDEALEHSHNAEFVRQLLDRTTNRARPLVIEQVARELSVEPSVVAHIVLQREQDDPRSTAEIQPCSKLRK